MTRLLTPLLAGTIAMTLLAAAAEAQFTRPEKPVPPANPAHDAVIREGVALHNQGDFDGALAKYEGVLRENPGDVAAIYQTAFALSAKKDLATALDTALRGAEYDSPRVGEFYNLIGNIYVLMQQPETAIRAFEHGISLAPTEAQLYYNVAVSYSGARRDADALKSLKTAVSLQPVYPSAHQGLAIAFLTQGHPVPALLAAARCLVLDQQTQRGAAALTVLYAVLRETPDQARGAGPPSPVPSGRTDEGDFRRVEELIYAGRPRRTFDQVQDTPEIRFLVQQMEGLIDALAAGRDSATSFAYQHYVPYYVDMKSQDFVEPFVHYIFQRTGMPGVTEWLGTHDARVQEFLNWTSTYEWARPSLP